MEWLQYLVDSSNVTDTYIALKYYNEIGWISDNMMLDLQQYLNGFNGDIDRNKTHKLSTENLNNKHHKNSLKYITILSSDSSRAFIASKLI